MLKNKNKGITLIALVITIIILLILAGISISVLTNQGLFKNAKAAQNSTEKAEKEQGQRLNEYEDEINKYLGNSKEESKVPTVEEAIKKNGALSTTDNTEIKDAKNNKIVVPAGFKIVDGATTVDKGIVIEDVTETATKGSQFVWVPVGTITKANGTTVTITLGRYDFDATTGKESAYSGSYIEEDANDTSTLKKYGNTIAKNITNFKNSAATNGGYYIGRYEARTATARNAAGNALTQITEKGTENVYNWVTQLQAAQLSQNMYTSDKFTSDLINSYAWDTATVFIQNCGTNAKYSRQNSLNTSLLQTGTNSLSDTSKIDVQCNIYDMASNTLEWTTETSNISNGPCVVRGGNYGYSSDYTSIRSNGISTSYSDFRMGFRPLLYVNV